MDERDKLFQELIENKAGCIEMSWNGFINLYTEGESCNCKDCTLYKVFKRRNLIKMPIRFIWITSDNYQLCCSSMISYLSQTICKAI